MIKKITIQISEKDIELLKNKHKFEWLIEGNIKIILKLEKNNIKKK
jgi:hypothetical protein